MKDYQGLLFSYAEVKKELLAIKQLADSFLSPDSKWVLDRCETELNNAQYSRENTHWSISADQTLRTRESRGAYRASKKDGGIGVYGSLCFCWQIRNTKPTVKKQTHFVLEGLATTRIAIWTVEHDELVAQWQFEAGDHTSPGVHFHSAVNQYGDNGIFPEWLKVPRFPGLLLSPLDGLEFLLGELFQLEWPQHVSKSSYDRDSWAGHQKRRLQRILEWQVAQVREAETTPWMSLKSAKPQINLLTKG